MNKFPTDLCTYNYVSDIQQTEFRDRVCRVRPRASLEKLLLAFWGKKTCFIICYVQVFIVFTKLARAAQLGDINLTPGPCSMLPCLSLSWSSGSFHRSWLLVPCPAYLAALHLLGAEILTIPVRRTTNKNRTNSKGPETPVCARGTATGPTSLHNLLEQHRVIRPRNPSESLMSVLPITVHGPYSQSINRMGDAGSQDRKSVV